MTAPSPPDNGERGGPAPLARRWLLNLALLAVVVALGVFLWYRSGPTPETPETPLTSLAPDTIRAVEIERPQEPTVRMERTNGGWRLIAPIEARVDAFAIDSLLTLAQAPADKPVTTNGADLARFGLEPPSLTVRLDGVEVHFGAAHPLEPERYVAHESRVYLVPGRFHGYAAAPYENFLDTRLIEPGRKLRALELPDFALTLDDGTWRRDPEIESLSSDRINAFVDDWMHARALKVRAYDGDAVQEQVALTVETPDGMESVLTIGIVTRRPELVLHRPDEGLQYHFPEAMDRRLLDLSEESKAKTAEGETE